MVGYIPPRRQRLSGRIAKLRDAGISGNMGFRRVVFEQIGGFDEMLGAGAYFAAMEDQELTYRVLAAGHVLVHVPEARVLHHGMRAWRGGGRFMRNTFVGVAAAYTKHLRRGDLIGGVLLVQQGVLAVDNILRNLAMRRGPYGFGRLAALFVGTWRSFELDVDRRRGVYRPRPLPGHAIPR
jgi:GT2 family glycosyltransferase